MTNDARLQNELVLSPGEYAFTQDITSGVLKVHTGPNTVNITGQEYTVSFDPKLGRFKKVNLSEAAQQFVTAQQGQYVVLSNPAVDAKQPAPRDKKPAADLNIGQRVIMQGPTTFALWPGQSAEVIGGHNLRSNQYLMIRIRDEQTASENWMKGVIKAAGQTTTDPGESDAAKSKTKVKQSLFEALPADLAVGKHYVVRGDEFSFYIPPTGVEVVPDENGNFVRDAVTLERLEYCILIDENGNKRYERGPAVVFPSPTEKFYTESSKGQEHIVFQPIELNEIQGLHVKVISDYEENGKKYKEGEELFIKGTETPIYFPRPEHSLVSYDGKHKHFAVAIPAGEARYVLERTTGIVRVVKGPTMMLTDPRTEVIVRRVLSDKQCQLWYPGNLEAQKYNSALRSLERGVSSTRGAVSEGEVTRSRKVRTSPQALSAVAGIGDKSTVHSDTFAIGAEEFERGASYTEPRTLTLDTKFSGVPTVDIWTGYAVMLVKQSDDAGGERRVEVGPKRLLLEYDEVLQSLSMSTGKPKTTDTLLQTVYLRVKNNQISDIISAETRDHVNVKFKVSLRGDFTGEPNRWFDVENYVKLICDHVRSMVRGVVHQLSIQDLYSDPTNILRDAILGAKKEKTGLRPGLLFEENGFQLNDVEVLEFSVGDSNIAQMLNNTQHTVVGSSIELLLAEKKLEIDKRQEQLKQERITAKNETQRLEALQGSELESFLSELAAAKTIRDLELAKERANARLEELKKQLEVDAEAQRLQEFNLKSELERKQLVFNLDKAVSEHTQELNERKLHAETDAVLARFQAAQSGFSEALLTMSNQETLVRIAEAMGIQNYIGGPNAVEAIKRVFDGTPVQETINNLLQKAAGKHEKK